MKKFKKVLRDELNDVICDVCNKSCLKLESPVCLEFATLEAYWGYHSKKDGEKFCSEICENCFDKIIAFIENIKKQNYSGNNI